MTGSDILMKRYFIYTLPAIIFTLLISGIIWASEASLSFEMRPNHIEISTFYNGTTVIAKGKVPYGTEAVLRISGHYTELHLKKKGKVAGLLWMNIGDVTIDNVPEAFMVVCSDNMSKKIDDPGLNLGYKYLEKMMTLEPKDEDKGFIFREFVKLQEKSGTYGIFGGKLKYTEKSNGIREFEATIPVPPKIKQGDYKVEAFAVKNDKILASSDRKLTLKQGGFPELVSRLAFNYSLIYGIGAVVIAIFAGLLMGVLFKGKGGAH